jgi:hypothetical protein
MTTKINNFEIINDGKQLLINIEAPSQSSVTSLLLWNIDTFKNFDLAYDLTYKLEQVDNIESILINAEELQLASFTDIYFLEFEINQTENDCINGYLGITYNLQPYYKCMLNFLLENQKNSNNDNVDIYENNLTITTNLLINSIEKSLEIGYYIEAIDMLKKLKKICNISNCKNCQKIVCSSCSKSIIPT